MQFFQFLTQGLESKDREAGGGNCHPCAGDHRSLQVVPEEAGYIVKNFHGLGLRVSGTKPTPKLPPICLRYKNIGGRKSSP